MPKMPGKKLPYVLDKLGLSAGAAERYVAKDSRRAEKLARKSYGLVSKSKKATIGSAYGDTMSMAVKARQRQVGSRYAAGALGLGSVGMYNNRSSGARGGPRPMTRARPGSGRNP
jgi:hypothetical protein